MSNPAAHSTTLPRSPPPQRPRPQYSLYDDIRCTGDDAPQSNLPMEVVCNIFDYANFTCAMSTAASSMIVHRYAIDATHPQTQVREEALSLDDQRGLEAHVPLQPRLLQGDVHLPVVVCS